MVQWLKKRNDDVFLFFLNFFNNAIIITTLKERFEIWRNKLPIHFFSEEMRRLMPLPSQQKAGLAYEI